MVNLSKTHCSFAHVIKVHKIISEIEAFHSFTNSGRFAHVIKLHKIISEKKRLIHSLIQAISIAPLQVHYYTEALLTQHRCCVGVLRQSAMGNCEELA